MIYVYEYGFTVNISNPGTYTEAHLLTQPDTTEFRNLQ